MTFTFWDLKVKSSQGLFSTVWWSLEPRRDPSIGNDFSLFWWQHSNFIKYWSHHRFYVSKHRVIEWFYQAEQYYFPCLKSVRWISSIILQVISPSCCRWGSCCSSKTICPLKVIRIALLRGQLRFRRQRLVGHWKGGFAGGGWAGYHHQGGSVKVGSVRKVLK